MDPVADSHLRKSAISSLSIAVSERLVSVLKTVGSLIGG